MKRNISRRKLNTIFLFVIVGLYSFISVGYSALSQNLSVSGDVSYTYFSKRLYDVLKDAYDEGTYARQYTGTHQDSTAGVGSKNIYYWYGSNSTNGAAILDKNNVVFAGYCWQMMRTTDTGGVKMIYNGQAVNNQCLSNRGNQIGYGTADSQTLTSNYWYGTDYTYDSTNHVFSISGTTEQATWSATTGPGLVGKYTCKSTSSSGTCSSIYYIDSYRNSNEAYAIPINSNTDYSLLGLTQYNVRDNFFDSDYMYLASVAYSGYMYGDEYNYYNILEEIKSFYHEAAVNSNLILGSSITDNGNGTYTINSYSTVTTSTWTSNYASYNHKYTCGDGTTTTCASPRYLTQTSASGYGYVESGEKILIAQGRNGLDLTNTLLLRYDEWAKNYSSYSNYKFTCNTASATCTESTLRLITAIRESEYQYVGNYYFGSDVTWDGSRYTLVDPIGIENYGNRTTLSTHHYFCEAATDCINVAYMHEFCNVEGINSHGMKYILLSNGVTSPSQALSAMQEDNRNSSTVKNAVEAWYKKYLLSYDNYIEDAIYCNERSVSEYNGWSPTGDIFSRMTYKDYVLSNDLSCSNATDKFSVSNSQARLTYKIGLLTASEANIVNAGNIRAASHWYWLNSPNISHWVTAFINAVDDDGTISYSSGSDSGGIRPVISLVPGTKFSSGTGTKADPYIVSNYITNTSFSDGAISGGSRGVTITFPSGCGSTLTCSYTKDNGSSVNVTSSSVVVNFTNAGFLNTVVSDDETTLNNTHLVRFDALYVSSSGNDSTGNGSIASPYKTISKAYDMAEDTATIYVMNNLTVTSKATFDRHKNITLTSCTKSGSTCPVGSANSIIRGSSFTDYLISATSGNLHLDVITLNGNNVSVDHSLIFNRGMLNIDGNATLQGNNNSGNGGAVYSYGNVDLAGTITNNSAENGGGIYNNGGELSVFSATISDNTATRGGGIYSTGAVIMSSGSIIRNTASVTGGGIYGNIYSSIVMTGGTIGGSSSNKNTAGSGGGGIGTNGTVNLSGSSTVISYNEGATGGGGVLVSLINPNALTSTINGITVSNNSSGSQGGGIYLYGTGAVLNITNTTITNNTATTRGGGVSGYTDTTLNISGCTISGNTANTNGGGIGTTANLNISNGTSITKNVAAEHGGGIYGTATSAITITSATIGGSAANKNTSLSGGGIYYNGSLAVSGTTSTTKITYNVASEYGGGISNTNSGAESTGSLTISGGTISYNEAQTGSGGGVYAYGEVEITGGTISYNNAETYGGGLMCKTNCTMSGGSINNNSTTTYDGAGVRTDGVFTLTDGTITTNSSGRHGGGISSNGYTINVSGGSIIKNTAANYGGGIVGTTSTSLTITGGTIGGSNTNKNTSGAAGGGIFLNGTGSIQNADVSYNIAGTSGGGIYIYAGASFTIKTGTTISTNTSNADGTGSNWGGGGIAVNGTVSMTGGTIVSNKAPNGRGGGVRVGASGSFTLSGSTNSIIKKNTANIDGGISVHADGTYTRNSGYVCTNNTPTNSYNNTSNSNYCS